MKAARIIVKLTAPDKPEHLRECAPYEVGSWIDFAERFCYSIQLESTEGPCIDSLDLTSDLRLRLNALAVNADLLAEPLFVRFARQVSTYLEKLSSSRRRTDTRRLTSDTSSPKNSHALELERNGGASC